MLTVAYCRVSTEEQAAEGYSIEGQADKLRDYARLHDLGEVRVVADPGRSGKDMDRPGLQQLLAMVERGHVGTVLVWRLDRLSRNLGDVALLADTFGQSDVALHSFTEKLDLSSATGRMFYNFLGSFAQFYREQLGENVRLRLQQAVKQGKWPNRLKLGSSRLDGKVVPNEDAPVVRRIIKLRAEGHSYRAIEQATGVTYSTVCGILKSRIYLGETLYRGSGSQASTSRSSPRRNGRRPIVRTCRDGGVANSCSPVECAADCASDWRPWSTTPRASDCSAAVIGARAASTRGDGRQV